MTALALALAVPLAAAHDNNNHGTIKVHDDEEVTPPTRNQPHVSCEFWIEGFNMAEESGTIEIFEIPPTGPSPPDLEDPELEDTWTGTEEDDQDGFHFNNGPYTLPAGHYRVEVGIISHPGSNPEHFAKAKTFWVDPCVECPEDLGLEATANSDGSVSLNWDDVPDADGYNVYRSADGGDLVLIESVEESEFLDTTTQVGVTYTYAVTVLFGEDETEICDRVQVTAIPFFGAMGAALAALGAIGAVLAMRRR